MDQLLLPALAQVSSKAAHRLRPSGISNHLEEPRVWDGVSLGQGCHLTTNQISLAVGSAEVICRTMIFGAALPLKPFVFLIM